jgi:uncharacterized membrane protein YdbT with pleckstrin-like domain
MARHADGLLMGGEYVVHRARRHPVAWLVDARFGLLAIVAALVMLVPATGMNDPGPVGALFGWAVAGLFFGGTAGLVWACSRWYLDDYVITNRRVIRVEGLVNRTAAECSLEEISDAILVQGFLGRVFDFGDLEILAASGQVVGDRYHLLHHAPLFKKSMLQQKQDIEDGTARRITAAHPPEPTIEDRLRQLAALRDQGLISSEDYEATKAAILARL